MIRTKAYSIGFKVIIAFFAFTGLILQTGLYRGDFDYSIFRMFTNISNLFCGIYFIICASVIAYDKNRSGGDSPLPWLKGICTMSITLTGIIAAAIIAYEFDPHTPSGISTVILHIITPILIMADWLIFDTKGRYKSYGPYLWLCAPYAYFFYIMISAQFMDKADELRFPYPFLDYESLGFPLFALAILTMTAFYVFIGYLCLMIDRKMSFLEQSKKAVSTFS